MSHCSVSLDDDPSGLPERASAIAASLVRQKDLKLSDLKLNKGTVVVGAYASGVWLGHKLLEIFQKVSSKFSKSCSKNNQKLLFVTKVARKNKTFSV